MLPTVSLQGERRGAQATDVSRSHIFLGYKPVIIALRFSVNDPQFNYIKNKESVCLAFHQPGVDKAPSIARLTLKKINEHVHDDTAILFYEGSRGTHRYLSSLHQVINNRLEKLKKRKPGNVGLPGNLADQVRIAYSFPRVIAVITVSDGVAMNMFPTDLHGEASEEVYLSSLREGGLANEQVQRIKKIVISDVVPASFRQTYAIGRNHIKEMASESNFSLHTERSETFGFPLPAGVTKYRELELIHSWLHGIHWIHHYRIVTRKQMGSPSTLAHVHQYYAQWRKNNRFTTEILWR